MFVFSFSAFLACGRIKGKKWNNSSIQSFTSLSAQQQKNMSSERNQIQTPSFYSILVGKQFNWVYIHTSTVKRQLNFIMGKLSNIFYSIGLNRQIRQKEGFCSLHFNKGNKAVYDIPEQIRRFGPKSTTVYNAGHLHV